MSNKIRYPPTTLEICDATLAVLREGMELEFHRNYPELICYNGRRWVDEMNHLSIYYVKTCFHAVARRIGIQEYDVRVVIIRNQNESLGQGLPGFWCTVWYRIGEVGLLSEPAHYASPIQRAYYFVPNYSGGYMDKVIEFDPAHHFADIGMLRESGPPAPIRFSL